MNNEINYNIFDGENPDINEFAMVDRKGKELIENAKRAIQLDKTTPNRDKIIEEAMNAMYDHFATYEEVDLKNDDIQIEIFKVENMLKNEFLPIQSEPIFDKNFNGEAPTKISTDEEAEKLLDYIVHQTRGKLAKCTDLKNDSLARQCINTSDELERICSKMGLHTIHIGINQELNYGTFHHFTIIRVPFSDGTHKNYLGDCTYRQFFTKEEANPRRIGVMRGEVRGCSIGYFMTSDEKRKEIAEQILQKGYIEATAEVIKAYFDAVIFSGRDKHFYEANNIDYLNPNELTTDYTAKDYLNIIGNNLKYRAKSIDDFSEEILDPHKISSTQTDLDKANLKQQIML
ncbi:MAG: hypothetical protein IJH39_05950 [Clostridia bacterium]|nr:hypothetical protein [Clostridia bacterium]